MGSPPAYDASEEGETQRVGIAVQTENEMKSINISLEEKTQLSASFVKETRSLNATFFTTLGEHERGKGGHSGLYQPNGKLSFPSVCLVLSPTWGNLVEVSDLRCIHHPSDRTLG